MAWYHFIPGIGVAILGIEKVTGTTVEQVVSNKPSAPQQTPEEEKAAITYEIQQYISALPVSKQPTEWFKNSNGEWILKFANGQTVAFEAYKSLSNTQRAAFGSSSDLLVKNLNTEPGTGTTSNKTGTGTSFFTTTNILIGVGVLAALGIVLFLIFRKNVSSKRK